MNKQLEPIHFGFTQYMVAVKQASEKQKNFSTLYSTEEALRRINVLNTELYVAQQKLISTVNAIADQLRRHLKKWGRMDGTQLTDDAKLFQCGVDFTREQLDELTERYRHNFTMLQLIKKYGDDHGVIIPMKTMDERFLLIDSFSDFCFYLVSDIKHVIFDTGNKQTAEYEEETIRQYLQELAPGGARYEELVMELSL